MTRKWHQGQLFAMTETLEQSVKRTAEYPFFCCCMKCVTARRLGNWLIFFFESMMDDDDGRGDVHQIPPPVHEQLQMPNREERLFIVIFLFGLKD